MFDAYERAYAAYMEQGNRRRAGFAALMLARYYAGKPNSAIAAGWRHRAEHLLEQEPECLEHGYLARAYTNSALAQGDLDRAQEHCSRMLEIGRRFGDRDLQVLAIQAQGRALVRMGRVTEGMVLLDEAMAAAIGGELGPEATGSIYCILIQDCQALADYRRAGEWTEAAERWCERQGITGFSSDCRVHRAEIMRLRGSWAKAEEEARRACEELRDFNLIHAGMGFYEIGVIRLRMGDLVAAEEAFRQAHELGRDPQPGLALLRLADGKVEAAVALINRALAYELLSQLGRARRLPAQVEIAIAAGNLEAARLAVEELEGIAKTYGTSALEADAACARGALELAMHNIAVACRALRQGLQLWQEVDAPYETAKARMLLAAAYQAEGDTEAAALEMQAARSIFERLGAVPDARRAADLLERSSTAVGSLLAASARATRTFMFTDIVKSTNLVEAIGDEAWEDLLRWHDQTLRSLFAGNGGEEVDHAGDGFFVAFGTPLSAIECAVAIQRALAGHRRAHGFSPQVRIGLHTTAATRRGPHYRGKGVHQSARIAALAEAGEILASQETVAADRARFTISKPRTVTLRGIPDPVQVVTIDWH